MPLGEHTAMVLTSERMYVDRNVLVPTHRGPEEQAGKTVRKVLCPGGWGLGPPRPRFSGGSGVFRPIVAGLGAGPSLLRFLGFRVDMVAGLSLADAVVEDVGRTAFGGREVVFG